MTQPNSEIVRRNIPALVRQHAGDAAHYWQQSNNARISPLLQTHRIVHFQNLLHANLDGLKTAGQEGYEIAFKNFERFKTQGEAFVSWYLALYTKDNEAMNTLWRMTQRHSDTAWRGTVSALAYLSTPRLMQIIEVMFAQDHPNSIKLAMDMANARQVELTHAQMEKTFAHPDSLVRASFYRWLGRSTSQRAKDNIGLLVRAMRQNTDPLVREQAAIASVMHSPRLEDEDTRLRLDTLVQSIQNQLDIAKTKRGLAQLVAQRRSALLTTWLGHAAPMQGDYFAQAIKSLPLRLGILAIAHHGHVGYLNSLLKVMANPQDARIAFWAYAFITGLEQHQSECQTRPQVDEAEDQDPSQKIHEADIGLPLPRVETIERWHKTNAHAWSTDAPVIAGHSIHVSKVRSLLQQSDNTQAQSFALRLHLRATDATQAWVDNRAPLIKIDFL